MSALGRVGTLVWLRFRVSLRQSGSSPWAKVALLFLVAWFVVIGVQLLQNSRAIVETTHERGIQLIFLSVFFMQVGLGLVGLSANEAFDVSRVFHLPVRWAEAFSAMVLGSLFSPFLVLYISPLVGAALGAGDAVGSVRCILSVITLLVCGTLTAVALNLLFLAFLSKRRLREITSLFAALLGCGVYLLTRVTNARIEDAAGSLHQEWLRWAPSTWAARILSAPSLIQAWPELLSLLVFCAVATLLGARFLRAAFLGQMPSRAVGSARRDRDAGAQPFSLLIRLSRSVFWREPIYRANAIRELVFILAPLVVISIGDQTGLQRVVILLAPALIAFSHMSIFLFILSMDGRGVGLLLLTPYDRVRLLRARGLGLLSFLIPIDLLLLALVGFAMGRLGGGGIPSGVLLVAAIAMIIFDLCFLSLGLVVSVQMPQRMALPGRRPIQGQNNAGCTAALVRLVFMLPAILVSLVCAALATLPLWGFAFGDDPVLFLPIGLKIAASILGVSFCVATFFFCTAWSGGALRRREEEITLALLGE